MIIDHIQSIVDEADAAAVALLDPIEGGNDFVRLNINDETRNLVQGRIDDLMRRKALLKKVMQSGRQLIADIEALLADGYPVVAVEEVSANVFTDLSDQRRTEEAFFALIKPPGLTEHVEARIGKRQTPV